MSLMPTPWTQWQTAMVGSDSPANVLLLSANHLKTWQKCRKRFELHVLQGLRWPTSPGNFEFGQTVHALMDHAARGMPVQPLMAYQPVEVQQAFAALQTHPLAKAPIVASEWGFTVPVINNVWVTGRMDRLVLTDNGVAIVDWKTGTAIPKLPAEDWQTRLYLYAAVEAQANALGLSLPPEAWSMVYIGVSRRDGGLTTVTVPYSAAQHAQTAADLQAILHAIQQTVVFDLPERCPDRYCGYRQVCGIQPPENITI